MGPGRRCPRLILQHSAASGLFGHYSGSFLVLWEEVLASRASASKRVRRDMFKLMRARSVLVDVAIDRGRHFETSRATNHAKPTFGVDGMTPQLR
ncbi:hypothetical protein RAD04_05835 [Bradyrhizobium sp. 25ACV]